MNATLFDETNSITIENNKAIERLKIPLPEGGGLVVLTGDNGCGKTEALNAVRAILGDKSARSELEPSDGERRGKIEGCGVTIKIGRVNTESGELLVAGLEDKLDISDLVDPGIADLNSADASRLKALLKVSGVTADIALFDELLGDTFELDAAILKERDIIRMAAGVKRSLEKKSRDEASKADAEQLNSAACLKACEGVDLEAECDESILSGIHAAAVRAEEKLKAERDAADKASKSRQDAQRKLDSAKSGYSGPGLQESEEAVERANQTAMDAAEDVDLAEKALVKAQAALKAARDAKLIADSKLETAVASLNAVKSHRETVREWQETLDRTIPAGPSDETLAEAKSAVQAASDAIGKGAVVRKAKENLQQADKHAEAHRKHLKAAEKWREAAKGVDAVLSDLVGKLGCPITVGEDDKGMRLMVNHKVRGVIPFSELSAGEKWATVIPIAANAVGENGLFVIPQEAYEGLQPKVRDQIIRHLLELKVTAITAECSDGPLRVLGVSA